MVQAITRSRDSRNCTARDRFSSNHFDLKSQISGGLQIDSCANLESAKPACFQCAHSTSALRSRVRFIHNLARSHEIGSPVPALRRVQAQETASLIIIIMVCRGLRLLLTAGVVPSTLASSAISLIMASANEQQERDAAFWAPGTVALEDRKHDFPSPIEKRTRSRSIQFTKPEINWFSFLPPPLTRMTLSTGLPLARPSILPWSASTSFGPLSSLTSALRHGVPWRQISALRSII